MASSRGRLHRPRRWWPWLTGAAVVVVALAVGLPFLYIHTGSSAPALALPAGPSAVAAPVGALDGSWKVGPGSQAGYRVGEVLLGQHTTAVGRTTAVTGGMTVTGPANGGPATVPAATFTVEMAQVRSDRAQRDAQFRGRILETARFPTSTFALTSPLTLPPAAVAGRPLTATATGRLTLHGVTRTVSFPLRAQRDGTQIEVAGQIPVAFTDYDIANPSIGGFVTTDDHGSVEVLLRLVRAG